MSFRRPLWIDLGGIAKGYAVDLALQAARRPAGISVCINAGGDLRIAGPQAVDVSLAVAGPTGIRHRAALSLRNRALASSQGLPASRRAHPALRVPHRDGRTGRALPAARFVSVLAPRCVLADALTKVVLGRGRAALPLLRRYGATALLHEPIAGWRRIGTRA